MSTLEEYLEKNNLKLEDLPGLESTDPGNPVLTRTETVRALLTKTQNPSKAVTTFCHNNCSRLEQLRNLKASRLNELPEKETSELIDLWADGSKLRQAVLKHLLPIVIVDSFTNCTTAEEIPYSVYIKVRGNLNSEDRQSLDDLCSTQSAKLKTTDTEATKKAEVEREVAVNKGPAASAADPALVLVDLDKVKARQASTTWKGEVDLPAAITQATPNTSGKWRYLLTNQARPVPV